MGNRTTGRRKKPAVTIAEQVENKKTIVFVEAATAMGGVEFSTLYLAGALDRSRWHPVVVCPAEGDLTSACRAANIETRVAPWPRFWSTSLRVGRNARLPNPFAWLWNSLALARATRALKRLLRQVSPDAILTKGLTSHFVGGFAARRLRIPCIWHVQDLISERTFGIYRRVFGIAARRLPQSIVVDGAAIKRQLPAAIHSRVSVIHNGVDLNIFRPDLDGSAVRDELGISRDALVIGQAARITPWKGQHYLIEAFAQIARDYPKTVLVFAGAPVFDHDGYERRLRAMAVEYGLQDRIRFAGYRHDLPNVLAAMDIFAFTSIEKDTSPLALLSAMTSALPIVAFDIEGAREIADQNNSFRFVPVRDVRALAKALSDLIGDEQLRLQLGQSARRAVESRFSLEQYVSRFNDILIGAVGTNLTSSEFFTTSSKESKADLPSATAA